MRDTELEREEGSSNTTERTAMKEDCFFVFVFVLEMLTYSTLLTPTHRSVFVAALMIIVPGRR